MSFTFQKHLLINVIVLRDVNVRQQNITFNTIWGVFLANISIPTTYFTREPVLVNDFVLLLNFCYYIFETIRPCSSVALFPNSKDVFNQ